MNQDGWLLSPEEEKRALFEALETKKNRMEWLFKNKPGAMPADVGLSDEEETEVLIKANKAKETKIFFDGLTKDSRERRKAEREALHKEWDYVMFYSAMKHRSKELGEPLIYNDCNKDLIKAMCFLLSMDSRYETELGFRFDRPLIIRGPRGVGKSWVPGLVADNPVRPMQMISMHEIARSVRESGNYSGFRFFDYAFIYLHDVGTEFEPGPDGSVGKVTHYMGNPVNWFRIFYEEMYEKNKVNLGRLIFSTNDSFDVLEKKYGPRVRDRMAEANILNVKGESMRRK